VSEDPNWRNAPAPRLSPPEHYRRAEQLLWEAMRSRDNDEKDRFVRAAQVHATLATVIEGTAAQVPD
jgi:hypothetical protein